MNVLLELTVLTLCALPILLLAGSVQQLLNVEWEALVIMALAFYLSVKILAAALERFILSIALVITLTAMVSASRAPNCRTVLLAITLPFSVSTNILTLKELTILLLH